MKSLFSSAAVLLASSLVGQVLADCECGFAVNATSDNIPSLYTQALETDFLHASEISSAIGWRPQVYNVTPAAARGPYGKMADLANVIANPLKGKNTWSGYGINGGDPGLQIWVRSQITDDMIPIGEVDSSRSDMLYGSFRMSGKFTNVSGTCGAFFYYRNNTQEIDMEFLSKEFNSTDNLVNLINQSLESEENGYDASKTPGYKVYNLSFVPDEGYHEYRFDWSPNKITFYADSVALYDMTQSIPDAPGHIVMNHWSNGDPGWSAGPPKEDAVMTISYVKAYFNSTSDKYNAEYEKNCPTFDESKVCYVPDQKIPANPLPTSTTSSSSSSTSGSSESSSTSEGGKTVFLTSAGSRTIAAFTMPMIATVLTVMTLPVWLL